MPPVSSVLPAVGADHRVGSAFLQPGLGWGGSCLPKDTAALLAAGRDAGLDAILLGAARDVNRARPVQVVARLECELDGLDGRRVALLGLAFKPGTDDVRCSPAVSLARLLHERGASISA